MGDPGTEILTLLDNIHHLKCHPFSEFLHALRSSAKNCVFGAGELAANVCDKLSRAAIGIKIHCCCDNDARKWGRTFFGGVPCIPLPELLAMKDDVTVLIVTGYCDEIYPQLKQAGVRNLYVLNKEYLILYADELLRRVGDDTEFRRFRQQVVRLMDLLADEESRRTAATVIGNWFTFSPFEQGYLAINAPDQYFPRDIIRLSDRETFVDLGAYDGKNTLDFIGRCAGRFRAAYAFEMDAANFRKLTNTFRNHASAGRACTIKEVLTPSEMRTTVVESSDSGETGGTVFLCRLGAGSKNEQVRYRSLVQGSVIDSSGDDVADIVRIDDVLHGEPVTFLKMDIEGAELEALEGAKETIRRWKPKVAACVYHHPDHLLQIPRFLKELVPEYRLFLRHHTKTDLETVCYAVC